MVCHDESEGESNLNAFNTSKSHLQALVEYLTDHIFILNQDGEYLFSNDRVEQFRVDRGADLIGKKLEDVYPPALADRYHRFVRHVFQHGQVISFEHDLNEPGGLHHHQDTLYPIYENGKRWAVGGICHDITRLKKYEKELQSKTLALEKALAEVRQTQRKMIDQERQLAFNQMASGIAHDFNNSLSTILGFSDLLLQTPDKIRDPESVKRYITLINTSAKDAAQIVRRLRKFYRPCDDEIIEPVQPESLIEEALALTEPVWIYNAQRKGITITIEKQFAHGPLLINGNHTELREVITNLIFNAVDAMPDGGTIEFRTRPENGEIVLEIADTGVGMDPAVRRQCLSPFFTTKGEAGSGLGLATVQGIISRHQGRIAITSEPGRGTLFRIHLPTTLPADEKHRPDQTEPPGPSSLKILVVDDEEHQRLLLAEYLQDHNHRVETAVNGMEGMQKFHNGWYDLVITDRAMPDVNGDILARNIRMIAPDKPLIMLTGFGDMREDSGESPEMVDRTLTKPVSLATLGETIQEIIAEKDGKKRERT